MCGIAGFWQPQNKSNQKSTLRDMTKQLYHRGPDGDGFFVDENMGLHMGHTRLSIVDLSGGDQPIFDKRAKLTLTANGEFYDYKKQRGLLKTQGHDFTTKSDSELALKYYQKYGLDFVDHLRGEFAFALFDEKKKRLVLVRDRFGIRPLFYHINNDHVVYGSEIKALLQHPNVPQEICPQAQLHQMIQVTLPGQTLYKHIHALKPGHMLIITDKNGKLDVQDNQYWDANFPPQGQHQQASDADLIEQVREKMVESVALRLEADVPVACYLSGGIDSCSILGMAASIQQSPVKAFTIAFDDDRYDESSIATKMAQQTGADQDILQLSANELYGENFEKAVLHSERTFYNTLGVAKMLMSEHVHKQGIKVVITGEGSDEIFGGYAAFKQDMFLHDPKYQDPKFQRKLKQNNRVFSGSILAESQASHPTFEKIMGFTPSWIQPWMLVYERVKSLLHEDFLFTLRGYDPIAAIAESLDVSQLEGRHPLDKSQYSWIKTMLEGQILNWGGDRVDMANSLESRPAFLDHHVVEMAISMNPHVRIRDGVEKWVLREAMKHILPKELYEREKFAFMAPPSHTKEEKKQKLQSLVDHHLTTDKIKTVGMLDNKKFESYLSKKERDHTLLTRRDIITNHAIGVHMLC